MSRTTRAASRRLVTAAVVGLVATLLTGPSALGADGPRAKPLRQDAPASRALAQAQDALDGTDGPPTRDATLALRDLAVVYKDLSGSQRTAARRLLDPPATTGQVTCNADICVHYTAPSSTPDPDASTATYAAQVLDTMTSVRTRYLDAGYRPTKSDGDRGGDSRFDVYLADIGDDRLYGYCNTFDDVTLPQDGPYDVPAFCVLDNDFRSGQFPTNTPTENLQVTAAHEYFHAVQFAYDFLEDRWLLEATATWAEDELYDDVDDNLQYLDDGPLAKPRSSLDTFSRTGGFHYGTWVFFRYLTERFPTAAGGMPVLVRDVFDRAGGFDDGDTYSAADDAYSLEAVRSALQARTGESLPTVFAQFADANLRPRSTYSEARTNAYPSAPPARRTTLSPSAPSTGQVSVTMNHLTSSTTRLYPSRMTSKWRLRIGVNMDHVKPGAAAIVTTTSTSGTVTTRPITLDSVGNGSKTLVFSTYTVSHVDLTMVNFGGRYTCWQGTVYSCAGTSKDDKTVERFSARAYALQ